MCLSSLTEIRYLQTEHYKFIQCNRGTVLEVTDNLRIGLMNEHLTEKVVLLILPSFSDIVFGLVFKHRTD